MPTEKTLFRCGPYAVIERLGEGATGSVWRAWDAKYRRTAAIKFMHVDLDEERRRRFQSEVRAQARLRHPGVVRIYDYGETDEPLEPEGGEPLAAGTPYLVMEFADGGSLPTAEPMEDWRGLRHLLYQLLDALAHAHSRAIVHRDLKPANIMQFEADPEAPGPIYKLADFGLAQAMAVAPSDSSRRGGKSVVGTPAYMAPEQFEGRWQFLGPWTDLYQLGIAAYEWWCGRLPFPDDEMHELAQAHVQRAPPPPNPQFHAPPQFEEWIYRAIAKSPDARFQRAVDAAHALLQIDDLDEAALREIEEASSAASSAEFAIPTLVRTVADTREGSPELALESTGPATLDAHERLEIDSLPPVPSFDALGADVEPEGRPVGTGRGIVGVARPAYVGRLDERRRLWEGLEEVATSGQPRATVIRGPRRSGKSRLGEWLLSRAYEMGAAHVLNALHESGYSRMGEFGGMVGRSLQLVDLDEDEIRDRIDGSMRGLGEGDDGRIGELAARLARFTWARIGQGEGRPRRTGTRQDWLRAVTELLEWYAELRPVVVVLDDLHDADEAVTWLRRFAASPSERPIYVVATYTPGVDPATDRFVETLEERSRVETIELAAPDRQLAQRAAETLLPMDASLRDHLVETVDGELGRLQALVGHLVEHRALVRRREGYQLDAGRSHIEAVAEAVWERRIADALGAVPGEDRTRVQFALEQAAAFGIRVDDNEWERACEREGTAIGDRLKEPLFAAGLAEPMAGGWQFRDPRAAQPVRASARNQGRWRDHHLRCARTVEEMYEGGAVVHIKRVAWHLARAGRIDEALDRVGRALAEAVARSDPPVARELERLHTTLQEKADA